MAYACAVRESTSIECCCVARLCIHRSEGGARVPADWMVMSTAGRPLTCRTAEAASTASSPAVTRPKTTCLASRCGAGAVEMKKTEVALSTPLLAMLMVPASL